MKIGKRLQHIQSMVTASYDHIWDCCCDHGLLGAALLSCNAAPSIHFVDIVPELMGALENKLEQFHPKYIASHAQWQTHCIDVAELPLHTYSGKHLVIIAGIGGDLMTELVSAIYRKNSLADIDFLLCPVHHQFTLRQQLIQLDFSLKAETLIVENQRFYEIVLVSAANNPHAKIHPTGHLIWQSDSPEQAEITASYLKKTLAHYQRMQLNRQSDVQHILDAYGAIRI